MKFSKKHCLPCESGVPPLMKDQALSMMRELNPSWLLSDDLKAISREFRFPNFLLAMQFVNAVAGLAEEEGHHPDITIRYSKVLLELSTHAIGGLSENDFILAANIDGLDKQKKAE